MTSCLRTRHISKTHTLRFLRYFLPLALAILTSSGYAQTQTLSPVEFYDARGKSLDFSEVVDRMEKADVVLFGEQHDHPVIHWIQLRSAKALLPRTELALGGEFFEWDDQVIIDEFLAGYIDEKRLESEAKIWSNYRTDYAPLLRLARDSSLRFIATNVPRRYASFVARNGLDTLKTLPEASRRFLPSLPVPFDPDTPGYPEMLSMMSGHGMSGNPEHFVQAQALKDYAMASAILDNLPDDGVFLHFNGDYHSADYGGIYWYLDALRPRLKVITIKAVASDDPGFDEGWKKSGDIILKVPADFTRTH